MENVEMRCCCLTNRFYTKEDPVPLKSVSVDVKIEGFIANVQSTLVYKNVSKDPIEARYEFPMDDQSAVYHFEAQIEDRIIIAECQEKEQAKETYDDALKGGYGAVLMQEDEYSSDIFSCLVGNLLPDTEAIIKFGYVTELSLQPDGVLTFLLPTLLNPRYNPSVESGGSVNPPDRTYIKPGEEQPYKFEIKAMVANPGKIVDVKAAKDELNVKWNNEKTIAEVSLAKPFVADHEFSLEVTVEEVTKPHIIIEKRIDSKEGVLKKDVLMLNFFPELKEADYTSQHEFIFVVDRSGSMEGPRIQMAKETLLLFLKSLPPGCYFNIVGFGSTFLTLFPEGSREYSEESVKAAFEHQKSLEADLGGTEILEPLQHIYEIALLPTHRREILLLTDGDVMNTQAVIDLVKKNSNTTRLFSFGIGEGASTALVKGIARAGRGKAEFTKEGERLQPLVVKTLKAAMQESVTDLHLDWQLGGGFHEIVQLPKELPPLFAGERLIIYGIPSDEKLVLDGKVCLKGKIGQRNVEFWLNVDSAKNISSLDETLPVHRLAAKAQIKQLQDSGKEVNKAAIVLLSTTTNVISCHTSLVGVDKNRKEKIVGDLVRQNVPAMSNNLYMQRMPMVAHYAYSMPMPKMARMMRMEADEDLLLTNLDDESCCLGMGADLAEPMSLDSAVSFSMDASVAVPPLQPEPLAEPSYMAVVLLQTFSGEWNLNEDLAKALNTSVETLQNAAPVKNLNVWATVLALAYLEAKFSDQRDEWEMVEVKARQWLDRQDCEGHSISDLLTEAHKVVGQP